jgi:hypothetical protein
MHIRNVTLGLAFCGFAQVAAAAPITTLDGPEWTRNLAAGGTAEIVELTGEAAVGAPSPTAAVKVTSTVNADRGEIRQFADFGRVRDFFTQELGFSYSYFKEAGTPEFAAPALKLEFAVNPGGVNGTGNDRTFVTLVYEPTWNQAANPNNSLTVPSGTWTDVSISLNEGLFWNTQSLTRKELSGIRGL